MNDNQQLHLLETDLRDAMSKEIYALREILANLQEEQHSLLNDDKVCMQQVLHDRGRLIDCMQQWREKMIADIKALGMLMKLDLESGKELTLTEWLSMIIDIVGHEHCEILMLRDQILSLVDRIDRQNGRNRFLLDLKVSDSNKHSLQTQSKPLPARPKQALSTLDPDNHQVN